MKRLVQFCIIGILVILLLPVYSAWGQEAKFVPVPSGLDNEVTWIGALEGSWIEMGTQYGHRASKSILDNSDVEWRNLLKGFDNDPQRIITLVNAYEKQIALLSPEMIEFMQGIAAGAEKELNKSVYIGQSSNYMRILAQQMERCLLPSFEELLKKDGNPGLPGTTSSISDPESEQACNGWWVTGPATKDGETYITRHSQSPGVDSENAHGVAFVLIPEDRNASVTFVQAPAGDIGGSGQSFNEYGVYLGWGVVRNTKSPMHQIVDEAIGVPDYVFMLPAVVFSKSAAEAKDYILYGTPKYRELTGRKTLLRDRGGNILVGDEKEAFVIEKLARQYAVRTPGYLGETGKSYIAFSNHFMYTDGSYDENDVFHKDVPSNAYSPEDETTSSSIRLWSQMGWFKNNYGNITLDMLQNDLEAMHYTYDKAGNKTEAVPGTGMPLKYSVCTHGGISIKKPLGTSHSWNVSLAVPRTREIYFIAAQPCQYVNQSWNYVNLTIYSKYRKAVYGY